jgi:hypothetical protein
LKELFVKASFENCFLELFENFRHGRYPNGSTVEIRILRLICMVCICPFRAEEGNQGVRVVI